MNEQIVAANIVKAVLKNNNVNYFKKYTNKTKNGKTIKFFHLWKNDVDFTRDYSLITKLVTEINKNSPIRVESTFTDNCNLYYTIPSVNLVFKV